MDVTETEIGGVDGVDELSGPELEERITRAIDPRVPVEVFFALLDRLAVVSGSAAAPDGSGTAAGPPTAGIEAPDLGIGASDVEVDDDGRVV